MKTENENLCINVNIPFLLLSVVLLHDAPNKLLSVNRNGRAQAAVKGAQPPGPPPPPPRSDGTGKKLCCVNYIDCQN